MRRNLILVGGLLVWVLTALASTPAPGFAARRDYVGLFTNFVSVGDVNGDGIPDLIATAQGRPNVLFGNGHGGFRLGPSQETVAQYSTAHRLVDLNGDGKLDLVFVGSQSGSNTGGIAVCLGNGDGTFQTGTFYPAGNNDGSGGLAVGDFNGDGKLDAVVPTASGIWLFPGNGDGTFNAGALAAPLEVGAGDIAAADFNGDGKLDVVVAMSYAGTHGDGFKVLFGSGNGSFQAPLSFAKPIHPLSLTAGPLTKGGLPAVVMTDTNTSYAWIYSSDGAGGFSGPHYAYLPGHLGIAMGDVNNDGFADLVSSTGYVAFGAAGGTFPKTVNYPIEASGTAQYNVALADLRNTGRLDIVTDSQLAISVLLNQGGGKFMDGNWTPVNGGGLCAASADFNGDGKADVAVNNSAGVSILLGTGSVRHPLQAGAVLPLSGAGCPAAGDLNGDGIVDLAVHSPSGVVSFLGHGDGTFTQTSTTPTAVDQHMVLADFNHDGKLDFATSANLLALGNGDGTFQTPVPFVSNPPAGGFSYLAAGDLNNDGWPDVVLTNINIPYSNVYVMLNNQHGGFTQVPANFGHLTNQVILADVNGDGNLDMVLGSLTGTGASIYLGDGKGGFSAGPALGAPVGGIPGSNMVADLNGDGIPDVAVLAANSISIYTGKGNAVYGTVFSIGGGPSPAIVLPVNLHGQAAGAGKPDLVLPDTAGGVTVLFNVTR